MISINNLSLHFTGNYLFENVSFIVADNDKIGLVGKNGAGKTTLLNILSGSLQPNSGTIVLTSGHKIGYLPQELTITSQKTIWDEALEAFLEIKKLERQLVELNQEISQRDDYQTDSYARKIDRLEELNRQFLYLGANTMEADAERVLLGLGFKKEDFQRSISEFSSGWQMRVELAKILLRKTEVLLLDEPTNHLDIESIQWLENFLQSYAGAVIMVSHDRVFLDKICKRTVEITLGCIEDYACNYSAYVVARAERRAHQRQMQENQQKEIADIEDFIERFRYKATKAKQVQSRLKMLDKMERIQVDDIDTSSIRFLFPPAPKCERVVFETDNLYKSYGTKPVLCGLDFVVQKGEKIAFVGRNGEGKTTMVRLLNGELSPSSGTLHRASMAKVGYFAQNHNQLLDFSKTVFQTIDDVAVGDVRTKIRGILGSFLFSNDDIEKKVSVLSGGEKSRLVLAKLLLEPYNVLILDEPTNHLDMQSKDVLKNALLRYDGTLILVSHDRDFLQGLTDKVVEFSNGHIKEYLGDIQYYLDKKNETTLNQDKKKQNTSIVSQVQSTTKLSWQEQKQRESEVRKFNKLIEQQEILIAQLDVELQDLSNRLADHEHFQQEIASGELYALYQQKQTMMDQAMSDWEKYTSQLEEIK